MAACTPVWRPVKLNFSIWQGEAFRFKEDDQNPRGTRLDAFLTKNIPSTTRSKIQAAIEQGNVLVDGTAQKKPNFKVFPLYTVSPQNMEVLLDFCFQTMCQGLCTNNGSLHCVGNVVAATSSRGQAAVLICSMCCGRSGPECRCSALSYLPSCPLSLHRSASHL